MVELMSLPLRHYLKNKGGYSMILSKGKKLLIMAVVFVTLFSTSQVLAKATVETASNEDVLDFEWDNTPEILTDEQMEELKNRSSEDFEFEDVDPMKRITSAGNFNFKIATGITSDKFSLARNLSSTAIRVNSWLSGGGGSNRTEFAITLYSKTSNGIFWKSEGLQKYTVGTTQSRHWYSLPVYGTFYMHVTTPRVPGAGKYVNGSGSISNFGSVK